MNPGLYQRLDGTVFWKHEDGRWTYLSPLFGEWLECWSQDMNNTMTNPKLKPYPRNIDIPADKPSEPLPGS